MLSLSIIFNLLILKWRPIETVYRGWMLTNLNSQNERETLNESGNAQLLSSRNGYVGAGEPGRNLTQNLGYLEEFNMI